MKTSHKTRIAEELKQQPPPATQPDKSKQTRKWLKVIEFGTVGFATWLNPSAGFLIFLLKLCFQILVLLQDKDEPEQ